MNGWVLEGSPLKTIIVVTYGTGTLIIELTAAPLAIPTDCESAIIT